MSDKDDQMTLSERFISSERRFLWAEILLACLCIAVIAAFAWRGRPCIDRYDESMCLSGRLNDATARMARMAMQIQLHQQEIDMIKLRL